MAIEVLTRASLRCSWSLLLHVVVVSASSLYQLVCFWRSSLCVLLLLRWTTCVFSQGKPHRARSQFFEYAAAVFFLCVPFPKLFIRGLFLFLASLAALSSLTLFRPT